MKIEKDTFLVRISEVTQLKDFCHFKAGNHFNTTYNIECIFSYELTPTQIFYFIQKGNSNKCAILYVEDNRRDESLKSEKYRQKFLNEKDFEDVFKLSFSHEQ